jgi:hypothetical protein
MDLQCVLIRSGRCPTFLCFYVLLLDLLESPPVCEIIKRKLGAASPDIALLVYQDVLVDNKYKRANVKLPACQQQRVFNILLNYTCAAQLPGTVDVVQSRPCT